MHGQAAQLILLLPLLLALCGLGSVRAQPSSGDAPGLQNGVLNTSRLGWTGSCLEGMGAACDAEREVEVP